MNVEKEMKVHPGYKRKMSTKQTERSTLLALGTFSVADFRSFSRDLSHQPVDASVVIKASGNAVRTTRIPWKESFSAQPIGTAGARRGRFLVAQCTQLGFKSRLKLKPNKSSSNNDTHARTLR